MCSQMGSSPCLIVLWTKGGCIASSVALRSGEFFGVRSVVTKSQEHQTNPNHDQPKPWHKGATTAISATGDRHNAGRGEFGAGGGLGGIFGSSIS